MARIIKLPYEVNIDKNEMKAYAREFRGWTIYVNDAKPMYCTVICPSTLDSYTFHGGYLPKYDQAYRDILIGQAMAIIKYRMVLNGYTMDKDVTSTAYAEWATSL